jgi:multiple sugar transport system permease protein
VIVLKQKSGSVLGRFIIFLLLAAFAVFILLPFFWMITVTLRPMEVAFKWPPKFFPTEFHLDSYRKVFEEVDIFLYIGNSLKIAVLSTALSLVSASLAAYAFARLHFPGRNVIFMIFLSAMMIPGQVTNIPLFVVMSKLHLVDTHYPLIIPAVFSAITIFMQRQFMMTIPRDFDEAAAIDGAGKFYIFSRIILPMSKAILMVQAVNGFIGSWNSFYMPLIYINSEWKMTIPLGLTVLQGFLTSEDQSSVISAALMMTGFPVILFMFGQKYLVEGIQLGGIKG